jgi:hypothetical protein
MNDAVSSVRYAEDTEDVGVVSPVRKPVSLCESTIVCDASPMPTASKDLVAAWLEMFSCAGAGNLARVDELLEAGRNGNDANPFTVLQPCRSLSLCYYVYYLYI